MSNPLAVAIFVILVLACLFLIVFLILTRKKKQPEEQKQEVAQTTTYPAQVPVSYMMPPSGSAQELAKQLAQLEAETDKRMREIDRATAKEIKELERARDTEKILVAQQAKALYEQLKAASAYDVAELKAAEGYQKVADAGIAKWGLLASKPITK